MNPHDDWTRWGESWRQQPAIDAQRLRRDVRRKTWRMRIVIALELLVALVAVAQLLWMLWQPGVSLRWKSWAGLSLALVATAIAMSLHLRRGTWRTLSDDPRDLLRFCEARAYAGIRLAKWNAWSTLLVIAVSLILAAPELDPARWQHDPQLRLLIVVQFIVNAPIVIAIFWSCAWYIRRQRRKLERLGMLLRESSESDG